MDLKKLENNIRKEVEGNIEYLNVKNVVNKIKEEMEKSKRV